MSNEGAAWYEPADPTPRQQCPCCDYYSLAERGNYLICKVCFWEDDGLDIDALDEHSGPNHMTLREDRANFRRCGACDEAMLPHVLPAAGRTRFRHEPRTV